jgi:hypothetical protein
MILSGMDSRIVENRFKKLESGILLQIEDPQFGSAFNTSIEGNRFDNVTVDVLTGSGGQALAAASALPTPTQPRWRQR